MLDVASTGAFGVGRPEIDVAGPSPTITSKAGASTPWQNAGAVYIRTEQRGATATPNTMPAPGVRLQSRNSGHRGFVDQPLDAPSPAVLAGSHRDNGLRLVTRAASEPERLDRPAPCVTAQEVKGTRGENMGRDLGNGKKAGGVDRASDALYLSTGRRRLSTAECAALFSMPPDYPWQGTKTSQYRQIGNMCAWRVVAALGRAVLDADCP